MPCAQAVVTSREVLPLPENVACIATQSHGKRVFSIKATKKECHKKTAAGIAPSRGLESSVMRV